MACGNEEKSLDINLKAMVFNWLDFIGQGAIAQLGERLNGIQEVSGSIPLSSTILHFLGMA